MQRLFKHVFNFRIHSFRNNFFVLIAAFLCSNFFPVDAYTNITDDNTVWEDVLRISELLLYNCITYGTRDQEKFLPRLQDCLKRRSLRALDRTINRDVIEFAEGIALVKDRILNNTNKRSMQAILPNTLEISDKNWQLQFLNKLLELFQTHTLKIFLKRNNTEIIEGRRRKDRGDMSSILVFSMLAMGMIMVPLGFQFLAVLGGKAILLAKMALILASISGLKKLATSNLNYGFYQTHPGSGHEHGYEHGHGPWHYDRQWPYNGVPVDEGHHHYSDQEAHYSQQPLAQNADLLHAYPNPRYDWKGQPN
ncbi:unnamed protein product [Brassicogethes aeneus]|uniref:Uncharacterized protein n=1 Tax=Brassicogethes aeneus TaxID=1431903 RepID=A0A9P0BAR4_BRAAE|nr:unnamed protein product [Brassicogethes aeneus]